jgi:hypothetical protein
MKFRILFMLAVLAFSLQLSAQQSNNDKAFNPLLPDFVADPSVVMFNDTFYLYGTTDIDRGLHEMGPPVVWKSADFVNWSFEGTLIPQIDWSKKYTYTNEKGEQKSGCFRYWAPGKPLFKEGLYYLFPTIVFPDEKNGTYVMVANHPEGPFRFLNGEGLLFNDSLNTIKQAEPLVWDIDGEPFIDQDGQAYLFWRRRNGSKMADDFGSLVGDPVEIKTNFSGYSEGPVLFERKGIYYYVYTLSGHSNYCNAYMMSKKSPLGPFKVPEGKSIFIHSSLENNVWGPGHGNVFQMPGTDDFYFLYLEYGEGGTTRQVFANKMEFGDDGSIQQVIPNRKGVGYLAPLSANKLNLATKALVSASAIRPPREVKAQIIEDPNALTTLQVNTREGNGVTRTVSYSPENAIDGSYGTRWMADMDGEIPTFFIDLKKKTVLSECRIFFTFPTLGHTWILEHSVDGKSWQVAGKQEELARRAPHIVKNIGETRYLRLSVFQGVAGIWEIELY